MSRHSIYTAPPKGRPSVLSGCDLMTKKHSKFRKEKLHRTTYAIDSPPITGRMHVVTVGKHPQGDPRHASRGPEGVPGWYRAKVIFGRPGVTVIHGPVDYDKILAGGDSQVSVLCSPIELQSTADIQDAKIFARDEVMEGDKIKVITHAELRINAGNFKDASDRAQQFVNRALSFLVLYAGLPIETKFLAVTEERTGSRFFTYNAVGGDVCHPLRWDTEPVLNLTAISEQLSGAVATFREGLNSYNSFYRFLCFFKVVEFCMARDKNDARAGNPRPELSIPADPKSDARVHKNDVRWMMGHAGKTFNKIRGEVEQLNRHAVAHLLPGVYDLDPGDLAEMREFNEKVPVIKYMAQEMLRARYGWEVLKTTAVPGQLPRKQEIDAETLHGTKVATEIPMREKWHVRVRMALLAGISSLTARLRSRS
jgi:methylamine utilization protein MauJ